MKFLLDLFDKLSKESIKYSIMRNYVDLPKSTGGSDIDVWVAKEHLEKFYTILMKCAEENHGKTVSYINKLYEPKTCIMGIDWGVQFDVYKDIVPIGNCKFFTGDAIWKHTILYNGVQVLDSKWEAVESFLKEVLNTRHCNRKEKFYIDASLAIKSMSFEELKDGLNLFSDEYIRLLKKVGEEKKNDSLINDIYKYGIQQLRIKNKFEISSHLAKFYRLFKRPGYFVVVLGTDGSGKSTIIDHITPILEGAFHHGIHYEHLRPNLIPDIGILFGKRQKEKIEVSPHPHDVKVSGFLGSLCKFLYYLQDYIWGYLFKILPSIALYSHVYILDRYYYDYYIDQKRAKILLPKWIIKIGEFFVPKPDIIICLGGNPDVIYKRKPETSLEEVRKQTTQLKKIAETKNNSVWIDTTVDVKISINKTMEAIQEMMSKRFSK
jgi:Thymidylate kinase